MSKKVETPEKELEFSEELHRATVLFEERQKLPKDHKFDNEVMDGCCHPNIRMKEGLYGIHCKSLSHICSLTGVDRDEVVKLFVLRETAMTRMGTERDPIINAPITMINPINASSNEQNIALPDANWVQGEALTFIKEDPSDNHIKFEGVANDKGYYTLNKIFDQVTFVTKDNKYLLMNEYLDTLTTDAKKGKKAKAKA